METPAHQLSVTPNCSLSWNQALLFFAGVCTGSFGVAAVFAWQGYWPILPFAGLEMMVLGVALWLSLRRGEYRELIKIYPDRVVIEKRNRHQLEQIEFPLHWAHVNLRSAHITSYPGKLIISSHGRCCEIGGCLTEGERRGLCRRLKQLIGNVDQTPGVWSTGET